MKNPDANLAKAKSFYKSEQKGRSRTANPLEGAMSQGPAFARALRASGISC